MWKFTSSLSASQSSVYTLIHRGSVICRQSEIPSNKVGHRNVSCLSYWLQGGPQGRLSKNDKQRRENFLFEDFISQSFRGFGETETQSSSLFGAPESWALRRERMVEKRKAGMGPLIAGFSFTILSSWFTLYLELWHPGVPPFNIPTSDPPKCYFAYLFIF